MIHIKKYYMDGCSPCTAMTKELESVSHPHTVENIDAMSLTPEQRAGLGIRSVPALILVKDGKESALFPGFKTTKEIEQLITDL